MSENPTIWRLSRGSDRRFRAGHPWVYSNELQGSPKGLSPGAPVELRDAAGKFLARGYGNPHSLIAFRALTRDEKITDPSSREGLFRALARALDLRRRLGLLPFSHRLSHGEADGLPGLVIDRYVLARGKGQVLCVQAHTAGADRFCADLPGILSELYGSQGALAIVFRNDLGVRKLEGLKEEEPRIERAIPGVDPARASIEVRGALTREPLEFDVDLLNGQKTGFFLDQAANIETAAMAFSQWRKPQSKIRMLDLCCYVGQWGAQMAAVFRRAGIPAEVLAVDASESALARAKANIERQGARCETFQADVLHGLGSLEEKSFDLVVSDPPALIKSRKDLPAGTHAYLQLNTQVFRLVKNDGAVVSCSCSGLLEEEAFVGALSKSAQRNGLSPRWIARGGQAQDHPVLAEFPEGRYLKGWIALC